MSQNDIFPAPIYERYLIAELKELSMKRNYFDYMMTAHRAYILMLAEEGIVDNTIANQVILALDNVQNNQDKLLKQLAEGKEEDLFFVIENMMAETIGIDNAGALHTGRSRNDLGHTIFRMLFRDHFMVALLQLMDMTEKIIKRGADGKAEIIVAWTHCQPAQPTTLAHYFGGMIEVLLRNLERLADAYTDVNQSPYGAAAITTTGFPLNRHRLAELLGFNRAIENSYGAIASTDYNLYVMGIIKNISIHLAKLSQDMLDSLRLEIGQYDLPDGWVQISSIMPQKRNVVVFEHLRSRLSRISGNCDTVGNSIKGTPYGDIDDIEIEYHEHIALTFEHWGKAIPMLGEVMGDIIVKEERVFELIDKSCILATELADNLVRMAGLTFRNAHKIAARCARYAINHQIALSVLPLEKLIGFYMEVMGKEPNINLQLILNALTPKAFIEVRNIFGGPGKDAINAAYNSYFARFNDIKTRIIAANAKQDDQLTQLHNQFTKALKKAKG